MAGCLPVLLIFGPLLPGLYWALSPALDATVWQALWLAKTRLRPLTDATL